MRVALFSDTYPPQVNGVSTHVKILKDVLRKAGHEVLVVTVDPTVNRHYMKDGVFFSPAVEIKRIYGSGLASPLSHLRFKLIRDFNPEVIHVHNEFGVGLSGLRCARVLDIPLVYTVHTIYDDYIYYVAPGPLVPLSKRVFYKYIRYFAKRADMLTGPSEKSAEFLRKTGVFKPLTVIPNPVELSAFSPEMVPEEQGTAVRGRYGIGLDTFLVCFVGRLGREKSVDLLLNYWKEAISPEENIKLMIVGDGFCGKELTAQAEELGLRDMVVFTGQVDHDDIPPYFAAADLYVTASLSDTNSISMLEAMAAGLPVLQRFDMTNKDQIIEGVNGFTFESADEMGRKIRTVKSLSPEERQMLRESVLAYIGERNDEAFAASIVSVYDAAVKRHVFTTEKKHMEEDS